MKTKVLSILIGVIMIGTALFPSVATAQTVADLQAQINALLTQITQLQAQLSTVQTDGIGVSCGCYTCCCPSIVFTINVNNIVTILI